MNSNEQFVQMHTLFRIRPNMDHIGEDTVFVKLVYIVKNWFDFQLNVSVDSDML